MKRLSKRLFRTVSYRHRLSLKSGLLRQALLITSIGSLAAVPLIQTLGLVGAIAQEEAIESQEDALINQFALPEAPPPAPVYRPAPRPAPAPAPAPVYRPAAPEPAPEPAPRPIARPFPAIEAPAETFEEAPDRDALDRDALDLQDSEADLATEEAAQTESAAEESSEEKAAEAETPTGPLSRYMLQFNRSPVVGNSLRMRGVYSERRLGFNRPTAWDVKGVQALIRYQHSPDLEGDRSNLVVQVNGTSVGSLPLNRKKTEIGEALIEIPPSLIQDYNEIVLIAQQNNRACSNPADPALWTEILPDSELQISYRPKAIPLAFENYPYPFFDDRALDANRLAYAAPSRADDTWLTALSRFHAGIGRRADFRPLESRFVQQTSDLAWNDRLVVIGTPANQPLLGSLKQLPFNIKDSKVVDGNGKPLPANVGVLMLSAVNNNANPVLVATGNGAEGIEKAVQFLQENGGEEIGTGQGILVTEVSQRPPASERAWPGHLPLEDSFTLNALRRSDGQPFEDVTVRTSAAPPIEVDFRALPDDRFLRGNTLELIYSYGPQLDPRTSTIEVAIDDVAIAGQRLTHVRGKKNQRFNVTLPENLIRPDSKIRVSFNLNPRSGQDCGIVTDRQLWATLHGTSNFDLSREASVDLPNLELMRVGYPFAAPQDLSNTTLVVPDRPSPQTLATLLEVSERLGRTSESAGIALEAFTAETLPDENRDSEHLIAIGTRDRFPLEAALAGGKLSLGPISLRQTEGTDTTSKIQTLSDQQGIIKQIISPWNPDRVVLALTAREEEGLQTIQQILENDTWFSQLDGDTVLASANSDDPSPYDPKAYDLEILKESKARRIEDVGLLSKTSRFIQERWFVLPTAIVSLALLMYGISQISLKRANGGSK